MEKEKNILDVFEELKPIKPKESWKTDLLEKLEISKEKRSRTGNFNFTYLAIIILIALNFLFYFEYSKSNSKTSEVDELKEIESEFLIKSSSSNY
ncbi:MAG: hypothetical protein K1X86_16415 [Ignavibacteria bacterium]|nr:hypothetical protein [Ignavibacteria bacterium]